MCILEVKIVKKSITVFVSMHIYNAQIKDV